MHNTSSTTASSPVQARTLWRCLCRSWSIGAAMSVHGMQRVGLLHALDPALKEIYTHPQALHEARCRYLGHVRTHTVMASLLVGFCIALERDIVEKKISAITMEKILFTTATTLSAIGDSFFSASIVVFWALLCALGIAYGSVAWVVCITASLLTLGTFFRIYTFYLSVHRGLSILQSLRKMNLINWAERIKILNALLITLFLWKISLGEHVFYWGNEFWGILTLLVAALLINRAHISRLFLVFFAFSILFFNKAAEVL